MLLKLNEPAPFAGALISIDNLKKLEIKAEEADLYKVKLNEKPACVPDITDLSDNGKVTPFLIGAGIGFIAGFLLRNIAK